MYVIIGFLESLDDFYMLSSKMVMLQTTNNVFNHSLYDYVQPSSLLSWQRIRMANMMAHNGREWAEVVSRYNSGRKDRLSLTLICLGDLFDQCRLDLSNF